MVVAELEMVDTPQIAERTTEDNPQEMTEDVGGAVVAGGDVPRIEIDEVGPCSIV